MNKKVAFTLSLAVACALPAFADTDQPDSTLSRAQRISSLTGPNSQPFHIVLSVSEPENPQSPYTATIEEFWRSANDWYRIVKTPGFGQQVIVTAGKRSEQDTGDYYPLWLRNFVTAAIDPLEDAPFWQQVSARIVQTTSTNGQRSSSCARAQFKVGSATVNNDAFAVICFNPDGTVSSVVRPGYEMEFHDPQPFGKKRIAYRYVDNLEPGTTLVGRVDLLEKIDPTTALPLPPPIIGQDSGPINTIKISQDAFETLSSTPLEIVWPPAHNGNTSGKLSMYVSADRLGNIREAYPLNSDNAGLQDAARDQLLKCKLRPAVANGQPVQVETALTFNFTTVLEDSPEPGSVPAAGGTSPAGKPIVISSAIAGSLQVKSYAPVYPQVLKEHRIGGKVELTAIIGKHGQIVSLTPLHSPDPELTKAAMAAVQRWSFKPYLLNGSPVEVETVLTVVFDAP